MKKAPLDQKDYLNPEEVITLYGLSRRKFYRLLADGPQDFMALYGKRKLILRAAFEEYLSTDNRREALKNGTAKGCKAQNPAQG